MNNLGWKLFSKELDALTHASNGGIAILRVSENSHATLYAENMVDFTKACRSLEISHRHIANCPYPQIILIGQPLRTALDKCER